MSRPTRLRPGIDPLVDPRDIADLASQLMSPRDRLLVFLVDRTLVGHLCLAVDLDHDDIARSFALVHAATYGTDLRGLVLAERTVDPLDLSSPFVSAVIDAPRHGLRIDAWVRFTDDVVHDTGYDTGYDTVHDIWPIVGSDVRSPNGPDVAS